MLDALERNLETLNNALGGRFVRPDMLHVTAAFLGQVDGSQTGRLERILAETAAGEWPIDAALGGIGYFGKPAQAVLWQGFEETSAKTHTRMSFDTLGNVTFEGPAGSERHARFDPLGNALIDASGRVTGAVPAMVRLSEQLRMRLDAAGFSYDPKPMRPHITLARKVDVRGVDPGSLDVARAIGTISTLALYHSDRIDDRLTYTPIAEVPLGRL